MSRPSRSTSSVKQPKAPKAGPERRAGASARVLSPVMVAVPVGVAACFFLSGTTSLMLEVVWTRLLRLVFGSTTLAVSTTLVAYMLGLGLGGLGGGRLAGRLRNGVRSYGWVEIGVGLYAAAVPWVLEIFPPLNRAVLATLSFWPAALARFGVVLAVLLVPTMLMGATLPILVGALVRGGGAVARRVGLLYGLNTLGAVVGVFAATFVLLPAVGVWRTNLTAAGLDVVVGAVALLMVAPRLRAGVGPSAPTTAAVVATASVGRWNPALLAYGGVGFTALVYEVCWTRALAMILGSSVYAFATMLAAFLLGIAAGSLVARRWFDRVTRPLVTYAAGLGLLGALALGTLVLFRWLPEVFLRVVVTLGVTRAGVLTTSVAVAMAAMLGPTVVLGALFPLLIRALAVTGRPASETVGDVYFVNTLGSAAGAFTAGFMLIPALGLRQTMAVAMAVNWVLAAGVLLWQREWRSQGRLLSAAGALAAAGLILAFPPGWDQASLIRGVYREPASQIDVGIQIHPMKTVTPDRILYYRDGINTTVSVDSEWNRNRLRVNGKVDAGTGRDMPTQVLLGEVPMLFGARADRVLVIGLASGVTVGSAALHEPSQLDVVELEPSMVEASHFFDDFNHRPLERPFVRVIADDGRNYLAYTRDRYDVIISEPSNPWITGAASLFTREFFHNARLALNPGGRLLQWVQLYNLEPSCLRSILAALRNEFPYVYGFLDRGDSANVLVMASDSPLNRRDLPLWEQLSEPVRDDLRRINIFSTMDLWSLVRLVPDDISTLAREATAENTDDNMYVELRTPWSLYDQSLTDANQQLFTRFTQGGLAVAEQPGAALTADDVGALAYAYASTRNDPAMARALVDEAQKRGGAAEALIARAALNREKTTATMKAAMASANDAIAMRPTAFDPWLYRAQLHFGADEYDEALADVDQALRVVPGDLRARYLRLQILNAQERWAEANADGEALIASPYGELELEVWAQAARAAAGADRYEQGIRLMRYYLDHSLYSADEWDELAAMYDHVGRAGDAAAARADAALARENLLLTLHQYALRAEFVSVKEAKATYVTLLSLDPQYEPAKRALRRLGEPVD